MFSFRLAMLFFVNLLKVPKARSASLAFSETTHITSTVSLHTCPVNSVTPHTSSQQCRSTHVQSTVSLHIHPVNSVAPHMSSQLCHSTHITSTVSLHYVTSTVSLHYVTSTVSLHIHPHQLESSKVLAEGDPPGRHRTASHCRGQSPSDVQPLERGKETACGRNGS